MKWTIVAIVADPGVRWTRGSKFDPKDIHPSVRVEPFDHDHHGLRVGYFIVVKPADRKRVIVADCIGIDAHRVLAQIYFTLEHERTYDPKAFALYERTIRWGGTWPPRPIMFLSHSYRGSAPPEELHEILRTFAPGGLITLSSASVMPHHPGVPERTSDEES